MKLHLTRTLLYFDIGFHAHYHEGWSYHGKKILRAANWLGILVSLAVVAALFFLVHGQIERRFANLLLVIQTIGKAPNMTSLDFRVEIWMAGARAVMDSPIWGYGIQHRWDAIAAHGRRA